MKIAINTLSLHSGHKNRGIGYYTQNLVNGLKQEHDVEIQEFKDIKEVKNVDVIHYPLFDLFNRTLPFKNKFSTVVTIHDVTPLVFPEHYPPGIKGTVNNLWQRLALTNIKAIITDSENSKKDIIKYLQVPSNKISVVYLASSNAYKPIKDKNILNKVKQKYNLPDKFTLFMGSVNWNKNLVNLTQASLNADMDIVLVGKDFEDKNYLSHPERKSYSEFLNKFAGNSKVHILGFVKESDLVALLNLSQVLLLPSFYEGFGLPILQAQSCGIPVITSKISSMPEVAGGGAVLVDPYSIQSIEQAVKSVIDDHMQRNKMIKAGFSNMQNFSWDKTVKETLKVYHYALES